MYELNFINFLRHLASFTVWLVFSARGACCKGWLFAKSLFTTNTVIKVQIHYPWCVSAGVWSSSNSFFTPITMAHHDRSIWERVIALAKEDYVGSLTHWNESTTAAM